MADLIVQYATPSNAAAVALGWTLKEYKISVYPFIMQTPERDDDPKKTAVKKVMNGYEEACKSFARPQNCIAVSAGLYLRAIDGTLSKIDSRSVDSVLAATQGKESLCTIRHVLAYINKDRTSLFPELFESSLEVLIAALPRGDVREFHSSKLVSIIKPKNLRGRTIAELPFIEYKIWSTENAAYGHAFGRQISHIGGIPH